MDNNHKAIRFQSTPPARGATANPMMQMLMGNDFNPRPPRGGRRIPHRTDSRENWISIHAPREGGDYPEPVEPTQADISIHAPREGGDAREARFSPPSLAISIHAPREGGDTFRCLFFCIIKAISIHAPREGGDSKDAQFYLRIFDKQVELLRFLGKIRGGCLRNPEKGRRFLGKSLANLPEIAGHLDFAGGGKAHPGYPCAVPLPRRAACVRGSGDPPADRCSSYRNAPLFSHIASLDSKSADCLSQNP